MWHPTWFIDHGLDTPQLRNSNCQQYFWDSHTYWCFWGGNLEVPPLTNETANVFFRISCAENATKSLWVTFSEEKSTSEKQKKTPRKLIFKKSSMAGSGIQQTSWFDWDIRKHCLLLLDLQRMSGGWSTHFQKNTSSKQLDLFLQSIFRAWTTKKSVKTWPLHQVFTK